MRESIRERFEKKIFYSPDGCWYWTGTANPDGYGMMPIKRVNKVASRVSFDLFKGPITVGMHVLHTCDNRRCVNPDHLYLGSRSDNMKDMLSKNRWIAKLKSEEISIIRESNMDNKSLARHFGVSPRTIYKVKTFRSWL